MTGWFRPRAFPGFWELVSLMAMLTALESFSIDTMLPALDEMGPALGAVDNQAQQIISVVFLGVGLGMLISGPLGDIVGRRRAVFAFVAIYLVGTLICLLSATMTGMLAGRVVQGLGAAGPYVMTFAIIRDQLAGREMARVNSWIMTVFILMPVISPLIGQGIIAIAGWRGIFYAFLGFALLVLTWFAARQPETLPPEKRVPPNLRALLRATRDVLRHRQLLVGTLVEALLLGAFIGYLSGSQPIFLDIYGIDARFPLIFAGLALFIGASGVLNANLVLRFGMRRLIYTAFGGMALLSAVFLIYLVAQTGPPALMATLAYLSGIVFFCGLGFANVAALAMEPVDAQAGLGASIFGGVSTLFAVPMGMAIGAAYNQTVIPLTIGFLLSGVLSVAILALGLPPRQDSGN